MKWLLKLWRLPFSDYGMVLKIYFLLHLSKWYIENRHLKNIVSWIRMETTSERDLTKADWRIVRKVARYTNVLSKFALFKSKCYDKALTVKKILNSENIPSALLMGVKTSEEKGMEAHAWISCDERLVIGGEIAAEYTPLENFV